MAAVDHELLSSQPRQPGLFVKDHCVVHQLIPVVRRMKIHLDDTGVWRDLDVVQPMIRWRRFAFDDHRHAQFSYRGFNSGDEIEIILGGCNRRHEHMEPTVARLNAQCGANNPRRALLRAGSSVRILITARWRLATLLLFFFCAEYLGALACAETRRQRSVAASEKLLPRKFGSNPIRKFLRQRRQQPRWI